LPAFGVRAAGRSGWSCSPATPGTFAAGVFHTLSALDDSRLIELFAREALGMLVRKELLGPDRAERILSWRHSGFNVHSLVRAKTKPEAERVGKYETRPLLSLERLSFLESKGKVGNRYGESEQEAMDYLEFTCLPAGRSPGSSPTSLIRARSWFDTPASTPTPIGERSGSRITRRFLSGSSSIRPGGGFSGDYFPWLFPRSRGRGPGDIRP
jgi:hypothetical protein